MFDCDGFSYVYKGAVSKYQVRVPNQGEVSVRKEGASAVNIFLDESGNVKIIEPQLGTIVDGKDWEYNPYFVVMDVSEYTVARLPISGDRVWWEIGWYCLHCQGWKD